MNDILYFRLCEQLFPMYAAHKKTSPEYEAGREKILADNGILLEDWLKEVAERTRLDKFL